MNIPVKIDPISIETIRAKGLESIIDWFEQHKQSFYTLGWAYLRNQQQIEELFYRSIQKVHKELPRFKGDTSFETWVTSMFVYNCRELSKERSITASEESKPYQDLFVGLDQLAKDEKEAVVLRYIKGISQEETAQLLQVSVEKLKELLFSGIQSLRKIMVYGSSFNGCKEYYKNYFDYLEKNIDRQAKVDFEIHIYHCQGCQEELAAFQDVMLTMLNPAEWIEDIRVPSGLMETVKDRLAEKEKQRQQKHKKRKRVGLVFVSVFGLLMGIGFFSGLFTNLYYTWTEDDLQLRAFLQHDLGERLNLEAESNGVRIKIKSAISDDVQTLVFYEIEDPNEDNQYVMNYQEGVSVENEHEIMNREVFLGYIPPDLESDINNEEKNFYHGQMSLPPLTVDNGTVNVRITKLQKLIRDTSVQNGLSGYENTELTGEWNFDIPVTKLPSIEYALDEETEIEGIPIRFGKLTIAPTATLLQYSYNRGQQAKQLDNLQFDDLEVNNKKVKVVKYGNFFMDSSQDGRISLQARFSPFLEGQPKDVNIHLESGYLSVEDQKTIQLGSTLEYPLSFQYAGSTISIDKVEVGQAVTFVISNHEIKNRAYEFLQLHLVTEDKNENSSMNMNFEGVLVDKYGKEYGMNEPFVYEKIEQPRDFTTVQSYEFQNKVIPKSLNISGYNTTRYLDDVVKISLD